MAVAHSIWIIFGLSSDRYEGTRAAEVGDLPRIKELLQPLEESGMLIKRSDEQVKCLFLYNVEDFFCRFHYVMLILSVI